MKSADVMGEILVSRGWGHYPRTDAGILWFTLETFILAPLFVIVQELFTRHIDALVRRYNHHSRMTTKPAATKSAPSASTKTPLSATSSNAEAKEKKMD